MTTQLIFIATVVTSIAGFIVAKDALTVTGKKWYKSLNLNGWIYIGLAIFLLILNPLQNRIQEKSQKDQYDILKKGFDSSLNAMQAISDTNSNRKLAIISGSLGKYGYAFDSVNHMLIDLRKVVKDSSKTKIISEENPSLELWDDEDKKGISYLKHENNLYVYSYSFKSHDAGSCCYELKFSAVVFDSVRGFSYVNFTRAQSNALSIEASMAKNNELKLFLYIDDNFKYNMLYLWIRGKYKNLDRTKNFPFNYVYFNNRKLNTFGLMFGEISSKIKDEVNKNEK